MRGDRRCAAAAASVLDGGRRPRQLHVHRRAEAAHRRLDRACQRQAGDARRRHVRRQARATPAPCRRVLGRRRARGRAQAALGQGHSPAHVRRQAGQPLLARLLRAARHAGRRAAPRRADRPGHVPACEPLPLLRRPHRLPRLPGADLRGDDDGAVRARPRDPGSLVRPLVGDEHGVQREHPDVEERDGVRSQRRVERPPRPRPGRRRADRPRGGLSRVRRPRHPDVPLARQAGRPARRSVRARAAGRGNPRRRQGAAPRPLREPCAGIRPPAPPAGGAAVGGREGRRQLGPHVRVRPGEPRLLAPPQARLARAG